MAVAMSPLAQFFTMKLVSREVIEDGQGRFFVKEVRRHVGSGDRLRLTYPLDALVGGLDRLLAEEYHSAR